MATPLTADQLLKALKAEGVKVVEVGNWRTHNRNKVGKWGPVNGVMLHHTVTNGAEKTVNLCKNGYSSLPGPLCHGVITKDGRVHMVGHGRANHAGKGDGAVLNAVIKENYSSLNPKVDNTDGNTRFYGFECENMGDGKDPWPSAQLEAIERVSAAICRAHGWNAKSVIGHLEWTRRKIDPRGFSMNTMRNRIAERLKSKPGSSNPKPAPKPDPSPGPGPGSGKLYVVQAGAFKDRNNAEDRVNALKKAGFEAFIDVK